MISLKNLEYLFDHNSVHMIMKAIFSEHKQRNIDNNVDKSMRPSHNFGLRRMVEVEQFAL